MKFTLKSYNRNVPDEDLINDLVAVSKKTGRNTVTIAEYEKYGKYHPSTLQRRYGSWFKVLENAGLEKSRSDLNIQEKALFNNIEDIWIQLGRQPKYEEVKKPFSKYSVGTYDKRFGSWLKALEKFVEYINEEDDESNEGTSENIKTENTQKEATKRKTNRNISDRLRFTILMRDGFTCQSCGASPTKERGVELHVDHIVPWSKGGETEKSNLQTKCEKCNLGKGNAFDK
jgi:hypothetical protein